MKSVKIIENRGKSLKIDEKLMKIVENRYFFVKNDKNRRKSLRKQRKNKIKYGKIRKKKKK